MVMQRDPIHPWQWSCPNDSVVSLDVNPTFQPDILADILTWDYKGVFQPLEFMVIACSPPCTDYSTAMTCRPRRLDHAGRLVKRALEIVDYLQPEFWFLENPRKGLLRTRPVIQGVPYTDIEYCQFSDWVYQKSTRFWGPPSLAHLPPLLCDRKKRQNLQKRALGGRYKSKTFEQIHFQG